MQGLENGDKVVVYQILHWALQRLPSLQKRAYLARFLVRVEIPPEFMQDDVLQEIHNTHRELQSQVTSVPRVLKGPPQLNDLARGRAAGTAPSPHLSHHTPHPNPQFKEVHKQVDALRAQPTKPQEIKTEITTLEDERQQLRIKVSSREDQAEPEIEFGSRFGQRRADQSTIRRPPPTIHRYPQPPYPLDRAAKEADVG